MVDAAVSKTVGSYVPCEFDSHLRHHFMDAMGPAMSAAPAGDVDTGERARVSRSVIFLPLICAERECE